MTKTNGSAAKRGRKRTNVWTVPDLEKRVLALIHSGLLNKKGGEEEIIKTIAAEFATSLEADKLKLSRFGLRTRLPELLWTKRVKGELWTANSNGMVDTFRAHHPYIPADMVTRAIRKLKGVTHAKSITETKAGMGRLSTADLPRDAGGYEFPVISYEHPFVVSDEPRGQLSIINGALVGIRYPDIEANTLRRALADARKRGCVAVVLTNLIDLWTKKTAGFLAVYRAMVSGIQINPDRFPPDYQKEVRDILSGKITDKTIYQTLNERFLEVLDGLRKLTRRPDDKGPEFTGPVYIQLGYKEEELINAAAYYELRYMTIVEQNRIQAELNMANHRLMEARDEGDHVEMARWSAEQARLLGRKARVIITNHTSQQYEFYRRRMRALVVRKLEEAIPNSKVLSQGSTFLKVHDKIIKTAIPGDDSVSDNRLANAGDTYGADVFRDTLADLTVVCAPFSPNFRDVGREDSKDFVPVTKYLVVAASCLDGGFLREQFKDTTRKAHPVLELIFDPTFKPGVLCVSWNNDILSWDNLPIERLDRNDEVAKGSNFAYPFPRTKYITGFVDTDNHFGAPDKRYIWDPKDRIHLGVTEATVEMMRRAGIVNASDIPVHFTAEMDDATNGDMWFSPRYRPDPQELSVLQHERWLRQITSDMQRAAEKGDLKAVTQMTEEINRISIAQLYFKGEDFPHHQMMMVYDRHIGPNLDFYSAVLGRFVRSGVTIDGISKLTRVMKDTRDLGVHNFPNGNHRIKTLEQKDLEGDYLARQLQEQLKQLPEWQSFMKKNPKRTDFFEEAVRAPRFGNETFGWGAIQAPGGFRWGLRVHGTPARLSSWSDLLAAVVKSDLARGDDSYGLLKLVTVTLYGDKHFYARAETERLIYVMCAAGVHTNLYGSSGGFPPNNTGVCFVSLPAGGPEEGPIIVRRIPHDYLRDWFAKPKPFDWDAFLPIPV
ncbi:MAG TPA: hypothetical protein VMU12_02405 [Candidatus Paceibacterota bacterium]|nr:hypothetical protein [Candidatus Paceibacterota bacterium]